MTRPPWPRAAELRAAGLLAAWAVFAGLALWGVPGVPFHPDESTHLFMSRDFDLLFRQADPAALTWRAANQPPEVIRYRLLDSPLTYYLPGLGRLLAGNPPALPRDWDWSATWPGNIALGTLPNAGQLDAARWPEALLTVLSLLPLYGIGTRLGGLAGGLLPVALYAFSGLVLLHGRRAMAEGPLLCFSLVAVWLLLRWPRQALLAGAATALAVAAKLTALALLPVAGLALVLNQPAHSENAPRWRTRLRAALLYGVCFLALSWLLTPALWSQPLAGLAAMVDARRQLLTAQAAGLSAAAPVQVSSSVGERLFAMLYHVYFAPPAFWDIPNYAAQTRAAELAYLAGPLQIGWHTTSLSINLVAGGLMLALTLAGLAFGVHDLAAVRLGHVTTLLEGQRQALLLLLAWTVATVVVLLPLNIAWQRYYLPLVPIVCLWAAYGLVSIARPFARAALRTR